MKTIFHTWQTQESNRTETNFFPSEQLYKFCFIVHKYVDFQKFTIENKDVIEKLLPAKTIIYEAIHQY